MIKLAECKPRTVYRLNSRNLEIGVFNGSEGFIGIREKFDRRYLFTEYHHDTGAPFGTATPLEEIGSIVNASIVIDEMLSREPYRENKTLFDILQSFEDESLFLNGE